MALHKLVSLPFILFLIYCSIEIEGKARLSTVVENLIKENKPVTLLVALREDHGSILKQLQSARMANPRITLGFLEEALNIKVDKFIVKKGSNLGDGFMFVLLAVDVWAGGNVEPLPLVIKCLTSNPVRQEILRESGMLTVELRMYDTVIPAMQDLILQNNSAQDLKLSFPKFYGGTEIVTSSEQLENYLIMADMRKSGGYCMADGLNLNGIDNDHMSLIMEGLALMHGMSWVLTKREQKSLSQLYPFLRGIGLEKIMQDCASKAEEIVAQEMELFGNEPRIVDALKYIGPLANSIIALYYPSANRDQNVTKDSVLRNPGIIVPNEEPWNVLVHGDCGVDNMLFRYDPVTNRPVELVFIDLQTCHEGDPFTDIGFAMLFGTKGLLRQHGQSLLRIYYDKFTQVCEKFDVEKLPGWSWEELCRRNHRGIAFGVSMSVTFLPFILQDAENRKDLEKTDVGQDPEGCKAQDATKKLVEELMTVEMDSLLLKERLREVIEDGISAGIV